MHRRNRLLTLACLSATLLVAGCGSDGADGAPATEPVQPTTRATTRASQSPLAGNWQVTLVPEAATAGVTSPTMTAMLEVGDSNLSGTVGETDINDGNVVGNTLSFETNGLTYTGVSGDEVSIGDPIIWKATLYEGDKLVGTATSNGVESSWEATR